MAPIQDPAQEPAPPPMDQERRKPSSGPPRAHIAVVAPDGTVLSVNKAWLRFARLNGDPPLSKIGVGANYFAVCRRAAAQRDGFAAAALSGILDVIRRRQGAFRLDYPCHGPGRPRWYRMTVKRHTDGRNVVVTHELIEPVRDTGPEAEPRA